MDRRGQYGVSSAGRGLYLRHLPADKNTKYEIAIYWNFYISVKKFMHFDVLLCLFNFLISSELSFAFWLVVQNPAPYLSLTEQYIVFMRKKIFETIEIGRKIGRRFGEI